MYRFDLTQWNLEQKQNRKESDVCNYAPTFQENTENPRQTCTYCDQTFSNIGNLNRHVQTHH